MKNKIIIIILSLFYFNYAYSENLFIEAKNISIDKKNELTIFKNDVVARTSNNYEIKSEYGEYNKKNWNFNFKK